jgi:hypothetical protein
MSNYIPHHRKKLAIRKKREEKLRRLISQNAEESKLIKAAEMVRDARVRAEQSRLREASDAESEAIEAQIEALRATTPESILQEFRR